VDHAALPEKRIVRHLWMLNEAVQKIDSVKGALKEVADVDN
jgi:hypothetical protein